MWGKRGESVLPYLKDKTQIALSGELANREYTDKDGQKRYSLEVRVNDLTLLGGKQDGQGQPPQSQQSQKPQQQKPAFDDLGDDVPF
jgi:single-strand DNA-binding protein